MEETAWKLVWDDSLGLDIPEIDKDHRRLISIIDAFNQAIISRQVKSEIQRILNLVVDDAKNHFDHEERLFYEYGYPDVIHHAALHTDLMQQLLRVLDAFNNAEFSQEWIEKALLIKKLVVDHLLDEDMKYRDFLRPKMARTAWEQRERGRRESEHRPPR